MSSTYNLFRPRNGREDLSEDLFELGPDPGLVVDARGAIVRANQGMEELVGLARAEILGRDLVDLVYDQDCDEVRQALARALRGHTVDRFEVRMFSTRGERWVAWRIRGTGGTQMVLFGRDVTEDRHPPSIETTVSRFSSAIERVEDHLSDAPQDARWGKWIAFLLATVGAIFAAGSSFAIWSQRNATEDEVHAAVESAMEAHADDEEAHEVLTQVVASHSEAIETLQAGQSRLEVLSRYQFHHARWQEKVDDARRRGRKPPDKPKHLTDLENLLMGFDDK